MLDTEIKKNAKDFAERWKDKGYEKGESQKFWIELLETILEVKNASQFINFEDQVHIDKTTGFIDGFIPSTKVMIEQKSIDKDLRKPIKQSDGSFLNPFQQAKRYSAELPYDLRPRWIVTCNFKSFLVYDMNNPNGEPEEILLKNISKEYYRLSFLVDSKNEHIKKEEELSFQAGELVGILYNAFAKEYKDISNEQSQKDLNELCVRLVFCLYAEDAGLFGKRNIFHDYLAKHDDLGIMRKNLIELFKILDTKLEDRDPYLEDDLNQFPYVNGGLFSNESIEIPLFTEEIRETLLSKASDDFDWSEISPTIFGSVFESTLNPEKRRSGGMHYTSIENIHKVIDPLFLNELREKLNEAEAYKNEKTRNEKLLEFINYMSGLKFFDPACGSGNFLTETYLSLRRLENEALSVISKGMMILDTGDLIKVTIQQFYGIEINDFAVKVAKTALWIAEAQMWTETTRIVSSASSLTDFLPLESYNNIIEGNALRLDWQDVLPNTKCNYIMGNPPFIGHQYRNKTQQKEINDIFIDNKHGGRLDYVCAWYKLSCDYIINTNIRCAFVSTSSICQGEHIGSLWKYLVTKYNIIINFAYKSFSWNNESNKKAQVWCIIVGFSQIKDKEAFIFKDSNNYKSVQNINPYLIEGENIFIQERVSTPPKGKMKMLEGSKPWDGGNLVLGVLEKNILINKYPILKNVIKPFIGGKELLNNISRYCLWFDKTEMFDYSNISEIRNRLQNVKDLRNNSSTKETNKYADYPYLFVQNRQPKNKYMGLPKVNSDSRKYLILSFLNEDDIASDLILTLPLQDLYSFAILSSNIHMAWMKIVCGRLGNGLRYSPAVYYNFPFPISTNVQKEKIEKTAQAILDARALYPTSSLADLYDELTMPPELRKAHQLNDKVVMEAYGFKTSMREEEIVAELMKMYNKLTKEK